MRKIIFLSILIFVALANAQIYLDKVECTAEGNPQNSCTISFSRFSFGQNFNVEGTNMFFFRCSRFHGLENGPSPISKRSQKFESSCTAHTLFHIVQQSRLQFRNVIDTYSIFDKSHGKSHFHEPHFKPT